jgi:glycerol uptake facilitator-like aquaporin
MPQAHDLGAKQARILRAMLNRKFRRTFTPVGLPAAAPISGGITAAILAKP